MKKSKKKMKFKEYEAFVMGLMSPESVKDFNSALATAGLGLSGEAGEVSDEVKKILFHGKECSQESIDHFVKELGDILFYVQFMAKKVCNVTLKEVMLRNVAKLSDRYKTGKFSVEEFKAKEALKCFKS